MASSDPGATGARKIIRASVESSPAREDKPIPERTDSTTFFLSNQANLLMSTNFWAVTDRLMRSLHLYTGLFLVPWMIVYAASALLMNHAPTWNKLLAMKPPTWETIRRLDFVPDDTFPELRDRQADAILERLDLVGPHRIQGKPNPQRLVILRLSGSGHYRITWLRRQGKLIIEQQTPFSFIRLINFLHFKHGYNRRYPVHVAWAIVVDAVALSIVFWCVSGIYLWARRPRRRRLGAVCVVAGSVLFVVLTVALCQ